MDNKVVVNTTDSEIAVMWDGMTIYFKPGQKKLFAEGVAVGIVNDAKGLEIEVEDAPEVVETEEEVEAEVAPEAVAEDEYTATETKSGQTQYRKNGRIIKKAEYEAAQK